MPFAAGTDSAETAAPAAHVLTKKAFVACVPSTTLSSEMQDIAIRASRLVQSRPCGAPFRGFCLLDLSFVLAEQQRGGLLQSTTGTATHIPIKLSDVMPCSYLCGAPMTEALKLCEYVASGRYHTQPTAFTFCEVCCLAPTTVHTHAASQQESNPLSAPSPHGSLARPVLLRCLARRTLPALSRAHNKKRVRHAALPRAFWPRAAGRLVCASIHSAPLPQTTAGKLHHTTNNRCEPCELAKAIAGFETLWHA